MSGGAAGKPLIEQQVLVVSPEARVLLVTPSTVIEVPADEPILLIRQRGLDRQAFCSSCARWVHIPTGWPAAPFVCSYCAPAVPEVRP